MYKVALILPIAFAVEQKGYIEDSFKYLRNTGASIVNKVATTGRIIHATVTGKGAGVIQAIQDTHNEGWCQREVFASYSKYALDSLEKDCPKEVKCQRTYMHLKEAATLSNFNIDGNRKMIAECGTGYWAELFKTLRAEIQAAKCRKDLTATGAHLGDLKVECPGYVACEETYRELKRVNRFELFKEEPMRKAISNCTLIDLTMWKPKFANLLTEIQAKVPQCNLDVSQEGADLVKLRESCYTQVNCEELYRILKLNASIAQFDEANIQKGMFTCGRGFWSNRFDSLKKTIKDNQSCLEQVKKIGKDIQPLKSKCISEYRCESKYRELTELGESQAFTLPHNEQAISTCSGIFWTDRFARLKDAIISAECHRDATMESADLEKIKVKCPVDYKCETLHRYLKETGTVEAFKAEKNVSLMKGSCSSTFWNDRFDNLLDEIKARILKCENFVRRMNSHNSVESIERLQGMAITANCDSDLMQKFQIRLAENRKQDEPAATTDVSFEAVKKAKCEAFVISAEEELNPDAIVSIQKEASSEGCTDTQMQLIQSRFDKVNSDKVDSSASTTETLAETTSETPSDTSSETTPSTEPSTNTMIFSSKSESNEMHRMKNSAESRSLGVSPMTALGGALALGTAGAALYNKDKLVDMNNSFRGKAAAAPSIDRASKGLSKGAFAGIVSSILALLGLGAWALYRYRLRQME